MEKKTLRNRVKKKRGERQKSEVVSQGGPGYNPTCGVLAGCNLSSELKHEKERKKSKRGKIFLELKEFFERNLFFLLTAAG